MLRIEEQRTLFKELFVLEDLLRRVRREGVSSLTPEERLRIGTVDAFQGMEFDVVFLSIVRSREPWRELGKDLEEHEKHKRELFGHLMSNNRLCVSMSRQKRLLVLVGNPAMLNHKLASEAVPALVDFHALCRDEGVIL